MNEVGVYSRLSAPSVQGCSLVQLEKDKIFQIGGVSTKKDKNHPMSHYLQLRMFHVPTARWLPQSVVSNGFFNRAYHASVALNDEIFVFGGENVGHRDIHPPLLYFQHAESEILKISKGFFGYKTTTVPIESEIPLEQLALVGHSATIVSYEMKKYVVVYGGFIPSLSGKNAYNSQLYIFSIEDAKEFQAMKQAGNPIVDANAPSSNVDGNVYVMRVLSTDPASSFPKQRAFHSATAIPSSTSDEASSTKLFIYGGRGELENEVFDDGWVLDLTEYLAFVHNEAVERKKLAEQAAAGTAVAAPNPKDAKKDGKKDAKKDAAAAVQAKPQYPFVNWKAISITENEEATSSSSEEKEMGDTVVSTRKRWDHAMSIWPLPSTDSGNIAFSSTFILNVTGGHGSTVPTEQSLRSETQQLQFVLSLEEEGKYALRLAQNRSEEPIFRLASQTLPILWGSRSQTILSQDILSVPNETLQGNLSFIQDAEGVAILVFGGFRTDEDPMGWPSRPGSPTNKNPSGMNHHLFDLSATIAASKTVTTIISPDLLATSAHVTQNPRKTSQLQIAEQDLLDFTFVLISDNDDATDASLSASEKKRRTQRNLSRDFLRRIVRGEDPSRVAADIRSQWQRANLQLAAMAFEDRQVVYPQTGNVYKGQMVTAASLLAAEGEAGSQQNPVGLDNEIDGYVPHGKGQMQYALSGDVYEGEWCRGHAHGNGVYDDKNLDTRYTGAFQWGRRHGQGHTIDRNSNHNSSSHQSNKGNSDNNNNNNNNNGNASSDDKGSGNFRWEHRGGYLDNQFEGEGEFVDVGQGLVYLGPFRAGAKEGKGKVVLRENRNTLVCEGTWQKDVLVGEGVAYALPIVSLNIIKGHLPLSVQVTTPAFDLSVASALRPPPWLAVKEDRKTLLIAGDYAGRLYDGVPHDVCGTALYSDGSMCRVTWKMGKRNGHGSYVFGPDRTMYEGKWVGDRRCGHGTWRLHPTSSSSPTLPSLPFAATTTTTSSSSSTNPHRIIYDGLWSENVYHGNGKLVDYDVDVVYEGQFRYGLKDGEGSVRPRGSDEEENERLAFNKTKTLAGDPASPAEMLERSQWIHDHTVLLPPGPSRANRNRNGVDRDRSTTMGGANESFMSYTSSPGGEGYGLDSPLSRNGTRSSSSPPKSVR